MSGSKSDTTTGHPWLTPSGITAVRYIGVFLIGVAAGMLIVAVAGVKP